MLAIHCQVLRNRSKASYAWHSFENLILLILVEEQFNSKCSETVREVSFTTHLKKKHASLDQKGQCLNPNTYCAERNGLNERKQKHKHELS
jgi:hypothetical protein